jgi:methyl-accepting chemotaxis protein
MIKPSVVPKLSFVKRIPEWDWIIGTGIYINDVEEEVSEL